MSSKVEMTENRIRELEDGSIEYIPSEQPSTNKNWTEPPNHFNSTTSVCGYKLVHLKNLASGSLTLKNYLGHQRVFGFFPLLKTKIEKFLNMY